MKKLAWLLGAMALVGLSACETDENNCGAVNCEDGQFCVLAQYTKNNIDMCTTNKVSYDLCGHEGATSKDTQWMTPDGMCEASSTGGCKSNSECQTDEVCSSEGICVPAGNVPEAPRLVRIDDLSPNDAANHEDPGADIDAVVLKKAGGATKYAASVVGYKRADGVSAEAGKANIAANPAMALGAPDSFVGYPENQTECYLYKKDTTPADPNVDRPFVSLGGKGGYLIVEMEDSMEAGDTLSVLELGGCKLQNPQNSKYLNTKGISEAIKISISISGEADGDWALVGTSEENIKDKDYTGIFSAVLTDSMIKDAK